jgi:hypothetical protein
VQYAKEKKEREEVMPKGPGTYGSKKGRPSKKAKNQKPMKEIKNGNGTKSKLTGAQKTLPAFLQKKIAKKK